MSNNEHAPESHETNRNRPDNRYTKPRGILSSTTNQLYIALGIIIVLGFTLLMVLTAPKPTLEQQVMEITKQNRQTWEHLNRIRDSTQWDKIQRNKN